MKTLDEVIALMECVEWLDWGNDALEYLKQYKDILQMKCSNCKYWRGRDLYDPNDPDEFYCAYEWWTYPDDSCSKWEGTDEDIG